MTTNKIGYIGLGKMGKNMALHLNEVGAEVVVWNRSPQPVQEITAAGGTAADTIEELIEQLPTPRIVWLMLPAGDVTENMISQVSELLEPGDFLIDGSNSKYTQTMERAKILTAKQLRFIDVGVSGGPAGARNGACLMIGGQVADYQELEPLFKNIAAPNAYQFFAGAGAGHFVKMVHNGIEYGMMQAIGEGFAVLKNSEFDLDLSAAAQIYNQRSVIESRLMGWLHSAYQQHGSDLADISGRVAHSGEGKWTVETAQKQHISVPVIESALQFRLDSKENPSYTGQVVSALRGQFGGHDVIDEEK